jgi:hypothetical protein
MSEPLRTAQIGKCGELLVQYRLLLLGIEAAPLSTDAGIDLVAYAPGSAKAVTIQVKANLRAKPGGGKGKAALDWWIPENSPAECVALVDLASESVWLMTHTELLAHAQQRSGGKLHLYMYIDRSVRRRNLERISLREEFDEYLLSERAIGVFNLAPQTPAP